MKKTISFKFVLSKHKPLQMSQEWLKVVQYLALATLVLSVILGILLCPEVMRDLILHILK